MDDFRGEVTRTGLRGPLERRIILIIHALAEDIVADQRQTQCNGKDAADYQCIQFQLYRTSPRLSFHFLIHSCLLLSAENSNNLLKERLIGHQVSFFPLEQARCQNDTFGTVII